jgi:hypothetical protein
MDVPAGIPDNYEASEKRTLRIDALIAVCGFAFIVAILIAADISML